MWITGSTKYYDPLPYTLLFQQQLLIAKIYMANIKTMIKILALNKTVLNDHILYSNETLYTLIK